MGKTTAPLLSFDARGQIAKTQVYSSWRGVPYVRRYVIPANPNSSGQQLTRSTFKFLSNIWKNASSILQAPWTLYSKGQPFYNRNAFIGQNTAALRSESNLTNMIFSPGAGGGVAPVSITATGTTDALTVTFTNPTAPTGWTIASTAATAIIQQAPDSPTSFLTVSNTATISPWTVSLTSLSAGTYEVGGWIQWEKPDGSTAYSPSINTTGTVA